MLAFRPDLDMDAVTGAVRAGVGPLAGATVRPAEHLLLTGVAADGAASWATDAALVGLVGERAEATYLRRGCVPFHEALGPDATAEDQEAVLAGQDVRELDDLHGFAVSFGDGFARGVGDPGTGRIVYTVPRPPLAARLVLTDHLPFGVCNDVTPIAEPTGL